jgi:hypothetical protein
MRRCPVSHIVTRSPSVSCSYIEKMTVGDAIAIYLFMSNGLQETAGSSA